MDRNLITNIFADAKAIIADDHFVYAKKPDGWYHGPDYVNKDAVYPFVRSVNTLCKEIASHFLKVFPDVVVGPTVGGVALAQWTANWLSGLDPHEVLAVCADEEDVLTDREEVSETLLPFSANGLVKITGEEYSVGNFPTKFRIQYPQKTGTKRVIKRGYDAHVKGKQCLIVEDVINSGATVLKTAKAIEAAGGIVVGVGALCNRSGGKVTAQTLGVPRLFSLLDLDMKMFREEECPICKARGVKSVRTDLGKGREFLVRIGQA